LLYQQASSEGAAPLSRGSTSSGEHPTSATSAIAINIISFIGRFLSATDAETGAHAVSSWLSLETSCRAAAAAAFVALLVTANASVAATTALPTSQTLFDIPQDLRVVVWDPRFLTNASVSTGENRDHEKERQQQVPHALPYSALMSGNGIR
jgi:hypothetical protein